MMFLLLAVPIATAMFLMVLGAYVHKDNPQERSAWVALIVAPAAAFGWSVLGYMLLQPFGIAALWVYIAPFAGAFLAVIVALLRLLTRGIKPFPVVMGGLLALGSLAVFGLMLSGVLESW